MPRRRIRVRPPGLKPWTRIGPLGPFRGRLGLGWVVAPLVVGAVLVVAVWLVLFRSQAPGGTFEPVGPAASFAEGRARGVDLPGVFIGRAGGQLFVVVQEDGCSLSFCRTRYLDCRGAAYALDGTSPSRGSPDLLPPRIYKGTVYVDPAHPVAGSPAPAPRGSPPTCSR